MELSREYPYEELTRRLIAGRAGIAYLDVCAHFGSVEALIATTCLDMLRQQPLTVEFDASPRDRVVAQFHQLIMLLAYEPHYGMACVRSLMSSAYSVHQIKLDIDAEIRRHLSAALGSGAWPELVVALQMAFLGAVFQAATDTASLIVVSERLGDLVDMVLPGCEDSEKL